MRKMKSVALLLAFVVVATAIPVLGAHNPVNGADAHKAIMNQTEGGGFINSTVTSNKSIFGFEARNIKTTVRGNLQYIDQGAHIKLHGNVTALSINKTARTANFSGWARVTNATGAKSIAQYTVNVTAGKKGTGVFNITILAVPGFLPAGYTDNGTLLGGNNKVD